MVSELGLYCYLKIGRVQVPRITWFILYFSNLLYLNIFGDSHKSLCEEIMKSIREGFDELRDRWKEERGHEDDILVFSG